MAPMDGRVVEVVGPGAAAADEACCQDQRDHEQQEHRQHELACGAGPFRPPTPSAHRPRVPSVTRHYPTARPRSERGHNAGVKITKLSNVDAFVVVDLDGAERATGIVRWAKKVLQDGAVNLARHVTYAAASLGLEVSGASAGINSLPDGRADAIAAFTEEVGATGVRLDPGKGVAATDLEPLASADDRSPLYNDLHDQLLAVGQVAALRAARGDLSHLSVAIEAEVAGVAELTAALTATGATVEAVPAGTLDASCDVLCVGSKVGLVDHENVGSVKASTILPVGPLPITARGLAAARRADILVLPDVLTLAGPLLAAWPEAGADADAVIAAADAQIAAATSEAMAHADGPLLGASVRAETFLLTWRDDLPFGRPIA